MLYFATLFDKNYLSRGIVLYNSINSVCANFKLYILCLDLETKNYIDSNDSIFKKAETVLLSVLESEDAELYNCKSNRSVIEYYFTLSACWPNYLLKKKLVSHICTLDADICFYSSPQKIFDYLNDYSIIITPHKFSNELKHLEIYGIYNVSFQIFKNDLDGLSCLEKWRKQCLNWCGDYLDIENNRFADQKYLDTWMADFPSIVKVLDDNVSGLAPWNINRFKLISIKNLFFVDSEPLIYFHFQHFKLLNSFLATNWFLPYSVKPTLTIKKLYKEYWINIEKTNKILGLNQDYSKRVNLNGKKVIKILDEKIGFIKINNWFIIFNTKYIPMIIQRIIRKIYA